jgi:hypothetical protein
VNIHGDHLRPQALRCENRLYTIARHPHDLESAAGAEQANQQIALRA